MFAIFYLQGVSRISSGTHLLSRTLSFVLSSFVTHASIPMYGSSNLLLWLDLQSPSSYRIFCCWCIHRSLLSYPTLLFHCSVSLLLEWCWLFQVLSIHGKFTDFRRVLYYYIECLNHQRHWIGLLLKIEYPSAPKYISH